ncbi:MAG: HAMP domain-containing sensor histidine kinase [Haloarculaceae archaeon]
MTTSGTRANYSGLVIAGVGFFLTRFTVTLAVYESPARFYLAGVVPLVLGLGLAAFGVALAVADVEPNLVRTTAAWCVAGTGAMLVLVVLTLLGSTTGGLPDPAAVRSQAYLSNFLIGGSVGGTLTGLYASRDRRQRAELRHQANRLEVLNRLLRHEVLNALTAIRGYATLGDGGSRDPGAVIEEYSAAIEGTIEEVKYLTRSARLSDGRGGPIDLERCLAASVGTVRGTHPGTEIPVDAPPEVPEVLANGRLERVFTHLLENAVVYSTGESEGEGDGEPTVEVSVRANAVRVSVRDRGPGLPERQQRLLETGDIARYDDPRAGYGLNVVRLLVESYRGSIETDVGPDGTTVTVVLRRAAPDGPGLRSVQGGLAGVRPATPQLVVVLGAAVAAGVVYGAVTELLGGSVGVIGVFYGVSDPLVGWLTHEFHSVVFGFVFAGIVSLAPKRYRNDVPAYAGIGAAWGLVLWFVAAGVVSAVWLRLLGIPAPLPSLSPTILASHLAWGVSLGVLVSLGYEHVTARLVRQGERRERGPGPD